MQIQKVTTYRLGDRSFLNLKEVQGYLSDEIGKILDDTPLRMDLKQTVAVHAAILRHKERLAALLTVEVEVDYYDGDDDTKMVNVLDLAC
jgi:hypothetical protein